MEALIANLDLLARRDFATLQKICGVDQADLIDMLAEIRALDPKPGARFEVSVADTIVPDVLVFPRVMVAGRSSSIRQPCPASSSTMNIMPR